MNLYRDARRETALDSLDIQTNAAFCGAIFTRVERLSGDTLESMRPKRGKSSAKLDAKSEVAMWDAWAKGISKRFDRIEKKKAEQLSKPKKKAAARG